MFDGEIERKVIFLLRKFEVHTCITWRQFWVTGRQLAYQA